MYSQLMILILFFGIPNNKNYWEGYSAATFAGRTVNNVDIIYGKASPKKEDIIIIPPDELKPEGQPYNPITKAESTTPMPKVIKEEPAPAPVPIPVVKEKPQPKPDVIDILPPQLPIPERPKISRASDNLFKTYAEAINYAKEKKCRVLAVFTNQTCPYCKEFEENTLNDPRVIVSLMAQNIMLIHKADCEAENRAASWLNIEYVPYYVVADGTKIIKQGYGYRKPDQFLDWIPKNDNKEKGSAKNW
jgi:hypothetical protein